MDKLIKNEIIDSTMSTVKKRVSSSVFGTYFIYWLIFHWNFVFSIFFVSEDRIWNSTGLLKNDYLVKEFFNYRSVWFYVWLTVPIILTYLTIWVFPRFILIPAFKKEQQDETKKSTINMEEQMEIEKTRVRLESQRVKALSVEIEKTEKQKKINSIDPTGVWSEEYARFKKLNLASMFPKIIESYYKRQGDIVEYDDVGSGISDVIPEDILAYAHSADLIEIDNKLRKITFTPKGKYFTNRYLEDFRKKDDLDIF